MLHRAINLLPSRDVTLSRAGIALSASMSGGRRRRVCSAALQGHTDFMLMVSADSIPEMQRNRSLVLAETSRKLISGTEARPRDGTSRGEHNDQTGTLNTKTA